MESCLFAITSNDRLTVEEGARQYNIPSSTVKDRYSGRCRPGTKPGPQRLLRVDKETLLHANYAKYMCNIGMGITTAILCNLRLPSCKQDAYSHS